MTGAPSIATPGPSPNGRPPRPPSHGTPPFALPPPPAPGLRPSDVRRLAGWLPPDWYAVLQAVAAREYRTVDQQVSFFVLQALTREHTAPAPGAGAAPGGGR